MHLSLRIIAVLIVLMGCGANCPETSNSVFPPPAADDGQADSLDTPSQPAKAVTASDDDGPPCGIPLGATKTEVTQRYGEPDATSEPQEVATEYHYYGKLLIIYRLNRVDDVILQQGGQCPE